MTFRRFSFTVPLQPNTWAIMTTYPNYQRWLEATTRADATFFGLALIALTFSIWLLFFARFLPKYLVYLKSGLIVAYHLSLIAFLLWKKP